MSKSTAVADGIRKDRALTEKLRARIEASVPGAHGTDLYSLASAAETLVRTNAVIDDRERLSKEDVIMARAAVRAGGLVAGRGGK